MSNSISRVSPRTVHLSAILQQGWRQSPTNSYEQGQVADALTANKLVRELPAPFIRDSVENRDEAKENIQS